jgi:hypothetical protein
MGKNGNISTLFPLLKRKVEKEKVDWVSPVYFFIPFFYISTFIISYKYTNKGGRYKGEGGMMKKWKTGTYA